MAARIPASRAVSKRIPFRQRAAAKQRQRPAGKPDKRLRHSATRSNGFFRHIHHPRPPLCIHMCQLFFGYHIEIRDSRFEIRDSHSISNLESSNRLSLPDEEVRQQHYFDNFSPAQKITVLWER